MNSCRAALLLLMSVALAAGRPLDSSAPALAPQAAPAASIVAPQAAPTTAPAAPAAAAPLEVDYTAGGGSGHAGVSASAVYKVKWGPQYAPYPLLQAACGDIVVFSWEGEQAVAVGRPADGRTFRVPSDCRASEPLLDAVEGGEYAAELLEEGLWFYTEPANCRVGQVLGVNVTCSPTNPAPAAPAAPLTGDELDELAGALGRSPAL